MKHVLVAVGVMVAALSGAAEAQDINACDRVGPVGHGTADEAWLAPYAT
jgi:hypothetical protein